MKAPLSSIVERLLSSAQVVGYGSAPSVAERVRATALVCDAGLGDDFLRQLPVTAKFLKHEVVLVNDSIALAADRIVATARHYPC